MACSKSAKMINFNYDLLKLAINFQKWVNMVDIFLLVN